MTKHIAVVGGLVVGAAVALIYVLDKNKATLDKAIDNFSTIDIGTAIIPQGTVTEGDPDDFTVIGSFGDITRAQQIRNKPFKV